MNCIFNFKRSRYFTMVIGLYSVVFTTSLSAQVTSVKLPTADSSASFRVLDSGNVVKLRLNGDGGFYMGGTYGSGKIPMSGAGTRMMWFPAKAAFRAGYISGSQWDSLNVGLYSTALGYVTMANGNYSVAMGYNNLASGPISTAMGGYTTASGGYSTAMGYGTVASSNYSTASGFYDTASGNSSTAMGFYTKASGNTSTAMGYFTMASGSYSTAMGYYATASGNYSTATGRQTMASGLSSFATGYLDTASGDYSTAMGNAVSTNGYSGSFIIGDYSTNTTTNSSTTNQMTMRFANGYRFGTRNDMQAGAQLVAGAFSWSTMSDSTKKTNFIKADHKYFLSSLSKLKLGSWNYKCQDTKSYRHYGPMAQEIFRFFGHDGKGTIGCDTLLATADMDGIMMICLQALEKRTSELQKANEKVSVLEKQSMEMQRQNIERDRTIAVLAEKIEKLSLAMSHPSINTSNQLSLNVSHEEAR